MRAAAIPSSAEVEDDEEDVIAADADSRSIAARLGMNLSYCSVCLSRKRGGEKQGTSKGERARARERTEIEREGQEKKEREELQSNCFFSNS